MSKVHRATPKRVPSSPGDPQTCSEVTGRPQNVSQVYRATPKRVPKLPGDLKCRPSTPFRLKIEQAPNRSSGAEEEPKRSSTGAEQESLIITLVFGYSMAILTKNR